MADITPGTDIIDTRDLVEHFDELRQEIEDELADFIESSRNEDEEEGEEEPDLDEVTLDWFYERFEPEADICTKAEKMIDLRTLFEEIDSYGGDTVRHGVTLIHDAHFIEYAQDFADDIGAVNKEAGWPNSHIDWEAAAADLQQDFASCKYYGQTYWYR